MIIKKLQVLALLVVFCLMLNAGLALAKVERIITPAEAIGLAFEHNLEHSLFLWEQELAAKRGALAKHPTVQVTTTPAKIENGQWQEPTGNLTFALPLTSGAELEGSLTLEIKQTGPGIAPTGNLDLSYNFFAPQDNGGGELSGHELRCKQENALVLQTLNLLINLRQALDQELVAAEEYELLQLSLQAAEQTPGYDQLPLRRLIREQAVDLAQKSAEIEQLQLQLASFLGEPADTVYFPAVEFSELNFTYRAEELLEEWFAASIPWRGAQAKLEAARADLEHEQKTKGWQVAASGTVDQALNWDVGLTATKTLYPRAIILEELELALARAEQAAETERAKVAMELQSALHKIEAAKTDLALKAEHLQEAEQEWELRQRELEAGLVTPLQLKEARLALLKAENDYRHGRFDLGQSILELWEGCGRELPALVLSLIN